MKTFKQHLKKKQLSISNLSKLTGLTPDFIYKVMRGDRVPSKKTALLLEKYTGYSAINLVFGKKSIQKSI